MGTRSALLCCVLPALVVEALSGCFTGPCECVEASPHLLVEASTDGGAVESVDARIVQVSQTSLECTPSSGGTSCYWPGGNTVDAGNYTIRVAAPGFETTDVAVTYSIVRGNAGGSCSCRHETLSPNSVLLMPGDGGP